MDQKKNIVILGAGFGGLRAARVVARELERLNLTEKYEVVLIDRNDHHTFTPLLYEVATTSKETANLCALHDIAAYPITSLLHGMQVRFVQSTITNVDFMEGDIHLDDGTKIPCAYAVIALGSEVNDFGIPGVREHTMALKSFIDAIAIRDKIWNLVMEANDRSIRLIIAGAGSTGVELAGELKAWCGELETQFPRCRLEITLIDANLTILNGFPKGIIARATKRLKKIGVSLALGVPIAMIEPTNVRLQNGVTIPSDVIIWAGGVKAPSILTSMNVKTETHGRAEVQNAMLCIPAQETLKLYTRVYAIGDSVCFMNPLTQKPIPGVARAAIEQANVAAHNILEEIKSVEFSSYHLSPITYSPVNYPYIIPIGGKFAIAKVGPFTLSGFSGWVLKGLVELNYLLSVMPIAHAFRIWLKGLRIFMQNDRLG